MPQADIVDDRLPQIPQALNKAVNQVRKAENKALMAEGDERLKGTRVTWLFNRKNLQDDRLESLSDLARQNLKTSQPGCTKSKILEGFWDMESRWHGTRHSDDPEKRISLSAHALSPLSAWPAPSKAHTTGFIINSTHRITNAVTEGTHK